LPQAASFTDDTSLPRAGCRVSIHAQIIREHQISWYFFLKDRRPHDQGEFKDQVLDAFFALAETDREKVFKTLRTVRIHIVDPRPYTVDLHDLLQKHLPKGTSVSGFLKRVDDSTRHLEAVRRLALSSVAESMLHDAPAERLKLEYKAWESAHMDKMPVGRLPKAPAGRIAKCSSGRGSLRSQAAIGPGESRYSKRVIGNRAAIPFFFGSRLRALLRSCHGSRCFPMPRSRSSRFGLARAACRLLAMIGSN
jgi:hypothetical protein